MKQIHAIFKKELLELCRDKAAMFLLLLPMFAFPLYNVAMSYVKNDTISEVSFSIISENKNDAAYLKRLLCENKKYKFLLIDNNDEDLLDKGEVDFLITIREKNISFVYLSSSFKSLSLATEISDYVQERYYEELSNTCEGKYNIELLNEKGNNSFLENSLSVMLIPTLIILMIFQSTTSLANNSFAGEKERKTLEVLLLSGIKRKNLLIGKSLVLTFVSAINTFFCLASYFITYIYDGTINQFQFMHTENRFLNITLLLFITFLLSLISVISSMIVSLVSSNIKNSQLVNELLLSVPTLFVTLISFGIINTENQLISFIPVLNIIISFSDVFFGKIHILRLVISISESFLFLFLIILFGNYYIKQEKILN